VEAPAGEVSGRHEVRVPSGSVSPALALGERSVNQSQGSTERSTMKLSVKPYAALALVASVSTASPLIAQAQWGNVNPPVPGQLQIGTTTVGSGSNGPGNRRRVGILAYCADIAHNAGNTGLQANKTNLGVFGAQNIADYLQYDDGIDRVRDLVVVDGDLTQPTATQLIQNFDIVIAYTDNKCGIPIPFNIANQAANALQGFIQAPNKGLILTGFAFSSSIGFGDAIFGFGLSPLRKGGPGIDQRCGRTSVLTGADGSDCKVGTCPAGCSITLDSRGSPECHSNADGSVCTQYQPWPVTNDFACDHMLSSINGPTSSSWATALTRTSVAPGATLCFNYDVAGPAVPYLAINAARNIIALNAFPGDSVDIQKFWFGCMLGDMVQWLSGDHNRCSSRGCR
jgi:hypothetical protein